MTVLLFNGARTRASKTLIARMGSGGRGGLLDVIVGLWRNCGLQVYEDGGLWRVLEGCLLCLSRLLECLMKLVEVGVASGG